MTIDEATKALTAAMRAKAEWDAFIQEWPVVPPESLQVMSGPNTLTYGADLRAVLVEDWPQICTSVSLRLEHRVELARQEVKRLSGKTAIESQMRDAGTSPESVVPPEIPG